MPLQTLQNARLMFGKFVARSYSTSKMVVVLVNNKRLIFGAYFLLVVFGGFAFARFEGKGWWDGSWWAIITSLSIGYGDLYPVTIGGRITGIVVGAAGIMIIVPIIIGLIIKDVLIDLHQFTDCEQKLLIMRTHITHEATKVTIENQHILLGNQQLIGDMLERIGAAVGVDVAPLREQFSELVTSETLESLKGPLREVEKQQEEESLKTS